MVLSGIGLMKNQNAIQKGSNKVKHFRNTSALTEAMYIPAACDRGFKLLYTRITKIHVNIPTN
jgi:helix-turn-helix protein